MAPTQGFTLLDLHWAILPAPLSVIQGTTGLISKETALMFNAYTTKVYFLFTHSWTGIDGDVGLRDPGSDSSKMIIAVKKEMEEGHQVLLRLEVTWAADIRTYWLQGVQGKVGRAGAVQTPGTR